jgi:hypothetical protein
MAIKTIGDYENRMAQVVFGKGKGVRKQAEAARGSVARVIPQVVTLEQLAAACKALGYTLMCPRCDTRTPTAWAYGLVRKIALYAEDMPAAYRGRRNRNAFKADLGADFPWDVQREMVAELVLMHPSWPDVADRFYVTQGWSIDKFVREVQRTANK